MQNKEFLNIPGKDKFNFIDRSNAVEAKYIRPQLSEYENNPLILALPPVMDIGEAIMQMAYLPDFDESIADQPDFIRIHKLNNGLRLFSPLDVHLDLESRISCLIRGGYIERNPLEHAYYKKIDKAVSSISQYGRTQSFRSTKYHGFNIIGVSGVGKTQAVERILDYYPQVITHSNFQGVNFTSSQLVWLKLDCPFDGSTKGLCLNFFQAVDRIFGTNYLRNYASKRVTVDEMLPSMALVASLHHLGVLVIDEIQRLSLAKSGGGEKMLNFFTQLVNTVGVPVLMVGTYKALPLFSNNISQARRGTGQGDLIWDRMAFDDQWEAFVNSLWKYQCTRRKVTEKQKAELSKVLYEETQGITDLAVKAFIFAQQRAIEAKEKEENKEKEEKLTPGIIRSVVNDKFKLLLPALEALRTLDKRALDIYEDLYPKFKSEYFAGNTAVEGAAAMQPEIKNSMNRTDQTTAYEVLPDAGDNSKEQNSKNEETHLSALPAAGNLLIFQKNRKNKRDDNGKDSRKSNSKNNVLRQVLNGRKGESPYRALLDAGYTRNGGEFFEGEIK